VSDQFIEDVRRSVAEAHSLPEAAAEFLVGTTLEELEASAAQLAELLTAHQADPEPGSPEESETMADVIARASFEKRERQRALIAALHPEPQQPRDGQGKFTTSGGLFGGGARPLVPAPKDPVREHDAIVLGLTQLSHLGRSQF